MTLNDYVRVRRQARRLSQEELVQRCRELAPNVRGISQQALSDWESGHRGRKPTAAQLDVLGDALELSGEERLLALRLARSGAARV